MSQLRADPLGYWWYRDVCIDFEKLKKQLLTYHSSLCNKHKLSSGKYAWDSILEEADEKKILNLIL